MYNKGRCKQRIGNLTLDDGEVAGKIHRVVKNSLDFDDSAGRGGIEDDMPSAPTVARDMQTAEVGADFVTCRATRDI